MKLKVSNAIFAILDLTMEMSAKQKAFHEAMLSTLCETDDKYDEVLKAINQRTADNLDLLRAKLVQYAEIDIDDFLNGTFEI